MIQMAGPAGRSILEGVLRAADQAALPEGSLLLVREPGGGGLERVVPIRVLH